MPKSIGEEELKELNASYYKTRKKYYPYHDVRQVT
jgi:hypothetical protein